MRNASHLSLPTTTAPCRAKKSHYRGLNRDKMLKTGFKRETLSN